MAESIGNENIKFRPSSTIITLPDPDQMAVAFEHGGTLQWRTDSHRYLNFRIEFEGPNPESGTSDTAFDGTDIQPVVIKLNQLGDSYKYYVLHSTKNAELEKNRTFRI